MNKRYINVIAFLLPAFLPGQVLPDQVWLLGTTGPPGQSGYGNAIMRFEHDQVSVTKTDLFMNFESTMAAMPDSLGNILFYTNGCHIANSSGDTIVNGSGLNPGEMADWTCPSSGYASPLGAMALPMPGSQRLYYLFHMGVKYSPERKLSYGPFYYSVVDMAMEGGKGAVVSKNNVVSDGNFEPFVAVRHGNGRDWWLVFPEYGTNKYHKILFSAQGLQSTEIQVIGNALSCRYIGSSAFSPNGIRYARQQHCGIVTMDFDRCSGQFSNDRTIAMPLRAILGGGVAFSKDGNKLLVSTQVSIQEADLTLAVPVLDTVVGTADIAGASLLLLQYGANGKIYGSNLGRTKAYHVINTPNEPAIGFQQRGLPFAVYTVRTLPNYPNYRLYDVPGSLCDTLGINTPMVNTQAPAAQDIELWPNPTQGMLTLRTTSLIEKVEVFDALGRQFINILPTKTTGDIDLDVSQLPTGLYFMSIRMEGKLWSGKFVKAE